MKKIWTKEKVFEEARRYQTRKEFFKGCSGAYNVARKNGWLSEMDWFKNGYIIEMQRRRELKKGVAQKDYTKSIRSLLVV